jgi:serine/threonine-protein kinase
VSVLPIVAGRYECTERLGGNMAAVYRAVDKQSGATVVVKLPVSNDSRVLARFRKEANILCRVRHPNIVAGIDAGEWQGQPYVVMEYLEGATLKQLLEQGAFGKNEQEIACWIATQIARGLRHLHREGIVHRDVKPDNIRVDADWNARIIDLGIARTPDSSLTRVKEVVGTPKYMAPEQVLGQTVEGQTDIYSFGVVFFEMLTGQVPYRSQQAVELRFYLTIINSPPRMEPLDEIGVPQALRELLARCLEKDKSLRWTSFDEVLAALEPLVPASFLRDERVLDSAPPAFYPAVSRRKVALWAGLGFAGGLAGMTGYSVWQERRIVSGEMVRVPGGNAVIGESGNRIAVKTFDLDKAEVSNLQFRRFCEATGHARPARLAADPPDMPVVMVSLEDARAYSKWAGKRLPTAVEWERAVRGLNGRLYPWGDAFDRVRANLSGRMMNVTTLEPGSSPEGALHLIGNAWEWVDESQARGGGVAIHRLSFQPVSLPPSTRLPYLGFRCARDVS